MNDAAAKTRGRPLVILALILIGWVTIRAVMWESPFAADVSLLTNRSPPTTVARVANLPAATVPNHRPGKSRASDNGLPGNYAGQLPGLPAPPHAWQENAAPKLVENPDIAGGHQLLWMAAMAHLPVPREMEQQRVGAFLPDRPKPPEFPGKDRWSLDAWTFWREGSGASDIAQGRVPSYGASQAAAVLRYRLAPQNPHDPRAYARAYRALIDRGESELALGLSARPLGSVPLSAHAELRVTDRISSIELRPAVFVTTELAPIAFPARMRAEAYLQAGYVGGKGATAFADGQIHLMRDIKKFDLGRISLGGAAWGGAQDGAQRLDIGPSLRFDLALEHTPARISLDYRERLAGNARPQSGVAVTVSSRF